MLSNNIPATFCGDIARLRINKKICTSIYVESFLRSELGQVQIYKWINGATNLHLATPAIEEIYIPITNNYSEQAEIINQFRKEIAEYQTKIIDTREKEESYFKDLL